jgi:hypothetical protein
MLVRFFEIQKQRLVKKDLDAGALAGPGGTGGDVNERAAWALLARVVFNLDEMVTKG